jgi:hypothetical protein
VAPASPPRIRCALLAAFSHDWAASIVLATPGVDFVSLSPEAMTLTESPNPFGLPSAETADVVLLSTLWYDWLVKTAPDRVAEVLTQIERAAGAIVGLDAGDEFALSFPPDAFSRFALVLKLQGLYRDRDLYNYEVGATYPGARWSEKRRPREQRYRTEDLEKLRLSVPCIMLDLAGVRRVARRREGTQARTLSRRMPDAERVARNSADLLLLEALARAPITGRTRDVHCLMQLSHVQRIEALQLLTGLSGTRGFSSIREVVMGTEFRWKLPVQVHAQVAADAAPFMRRGMSRTRFMLDLSRHKVGVAPTGFGELGQRHAAVMRAGAALVCQDLSHVEMMFPIEHGRNASFCKPDLSDLRATVDELLADQELRRRIAHEGRRSLLDWSAHWKHHLDAGVRRPLSEAIGRREPIFAPPT